ncbi:MAG: hypothetical protein V7603_5179 [Micromonosporaceae bacterium]
MRVFNVRCSGELAEALAGAVQAVAEREREWWQAQREAVARRVAAEELSTAQRALLLADLETEFARLRETGELRGTRTAYVLPALGTVLAERGWARRWKPIPPGAQRRRGRPWGTHDAGYDARVTLYLPDALGETLARACYWTSAPTVARLQAWYDEFGDHWRGHLHNSRARWTGRGPTQADLGTRDQLTAKINTTGRVLRQAMRRALDSEER